MTAQPVRQTRCLSQGAVQADRRRICAIGLVLQLACCGLLQAQTFNLATDREPVASLDASGGSIPATTPAWANPAYDDSAWPLLRSE